MSSHKINIELSADGGKAVADEIGKVGKASTDLIVNVKKIGRAFGEFGGFFGDLVSNILKGGVWGIMNAVISGAVSLFGKWRDSAKEAAEAAAKAAEEAAERQKKAVDEYAAAIDKLAKTSIEASNANLKRINAELDATQKLTKATLELERERARASGDYSGVSNADAAIADLDLEVEEKRRTARLAGFDEQERALQKQAEGNSVVLDRRQSALADALNTLKQREEAVRSQAAAWARGSLTMVANGGMPTVGYLPASDQDRREAIDDAVYEFHQSDEYKKMSEAVETARKDVKDALSASKSIYAKIDELREERQNFETEIAAQDIEREKEALKAPCQPLQ